MNKTHHALLSALSLDMFCPEPVLVKMMIGFLVYQMMQKRGCVFCTLRAIPTSLAQIRRSSACIIQNTCVLMSLHQ
jgi:hypothetical protein